MIKVYNSKTGKWLEPMILFFGKDGVIWRVDAVEPNEDPMYDGWYKIEGDDLQYVSIVGDVQHGIELLPQKT
jgi:hypothetical protein